MTPEQWQRVREQAFSQIVERCHADGLNIPLSELRAAHDGPGDWWDSVERVRALIQRYRERPAYRTIESPATESPS